MIEELIARMFALRDRAHLAHWAADSFSEHSAFGELYDAIPDHLDALVESYQGCYGKVGAPPRVSAAGKIHPLIRENLTWIEANGPAICRNLRHLQNLLDNLTGALSRAYYKLENLK